VTDNGFAWCLDAKTGKKFWTERMGKAHHASLVHVDGHILVFDEEGICHILVDGPEFKLLRRNRLGDSCHATPAIAGSTLVVRTGKALWRIGEKLR
jgi:outer membrane protein assembly factor BamB